MLLNQSRRIAVLGLLLAINQIFIVLASLIDVSSLTMMAIAALVIGIAICEYGQKAGVLFFLASCLLGMILSPNKLYMLSYAMMGIYVLIKEILDRRFLGRWNRWLLQGVKLICFNVYFIPVLLLFPEAVMDPGEQRPLLFVVWLLAQAAVVLCDMVYDRLLIIYYQRIRKHIRS